VVIGFVVGVVVRQVDNRTKICRALRRALTHARRHELRSGGSQTRSSVFECVKGSLYTLFAVMRHFRWSGGTPAGRVRHVINDSDQFVNVLIGFREKVVADAGIGWEVKEKLVALGMKEGEAEQPEEGVSDRLNSH
jgi:hypothetical protein